ncbi:MAG: type-F conjugative transfer system secretin TraK [Thermodesulfobacteriota bacterium]
MEKTRKIRKTSLLLAVLAGLLAAIGDSQPKAAAEPILVAAPSGSETTKAMAGEKQKNDKAASAPDSQDSPAKERESEVSRRVMAAMAKIKAGQARGGRGLSSSREVVTVTPGRNVKINIAAGHLNRIVTPFEDPALHTVDKAKTRVDGNSIYVSLGKDDGEAAMFITEKGQDDPSISLTLVPTEMAPKEVRLKLDGNWPVTMGSSSGPSSKAAKWEQKQASYLDFIEKMLKHTALGEIPQGYNLRDYFNYDPQVSCRLPVHIEPRQVLEGSSFIVIISRITNRSSSPLVVNEEACYRPGVRAVSVWPRVRMEPRQTGEMYTVMRRSSPQAPRIRPSVLNLLPGEVLR